MVVVQPPEPAWIAPTGFVIQTLCICFFTFIIGRWLGGLSSKRDSR